MLFFAVSCQKSEPITVTAQNFQDGVDKITEIMVHDIFSPPGGKQNIRLPEYCGI